jgi:hypothetical protein
MTSIPGAGGCRSPLAKSASACDTAAMDELSRRLRGWDPLRVAVIGSAAGAALLLAAYVVGAAVSQPTPGGVVSALALLAIVGSGLLYAWRLGAGGIVD